MKELGLSPKAYKGSWRSSNEGPLLDASLFVYVPLDSNEHERFYGRAVADTLVTEVPYEVGPELHRQSSLTVPLSPPFRGKNVGDR